MPVFITQGRYTREAIKGMVVKPEDRSDAVAGAGGGVTDLRTTVAMNAIEAKGALAAASDLTASYRTPGGV
jgi:hypothetical protein